MVGHNYYRVTRPQQHNESRPELVISNESSELDMGMNHVDSRKIAKASFPERLGRPRIADGASSLSQLWLCPGHGPFSGR